MITSLRRHDHCIVRDRVLPTPDTQQSSWLRYWYFAMLGCTTICFCGHLDVFERLAGGQVRFHAPYREQSSFNGFIID